MLLLTGLLVFSLKASCSRAASTLDQAISFLLKVPHYVQGTGYSPDDASIMKSVYRRLLTTKEKAHKQYTLKRTLERALDDGGTWEKKDRK